MGEVQILQNRLRNKKEKKRTYIWIKRERENHGLLLFFSFPGKFYGKIIYEGEINCGENFH